MPTYYLRMISYDNASIELAQLNLSIAESALEKARARSDWNEVERIAREVFFWFNVVRRKQLDKA